MQMDTFETCDTTETTHDSISTAGTISEGIHFCRKLRLYSHTPASYNTVHFRPRRGPDSIVLPFQSEFESAASSF